MWSNAAAVLSRPERSGGGGGGDGSVAGRRRSRLRGDSGGAAVPGGVGSGERLRTHGPLRGCVTPTWRPEVSATQVRVGAVQLGVRRGRGVVTAPGGGPTGLGVHRVPGRGADRDRPALGQLPGGQAHPRRRTAEFAPSPRILGSPVTRALSPPVNRSGRQVSG